MAVAKQDFASWVCETLRRRGRVVIPSRGRSMHPAIPDGAYVEVRPVAFDELAVGDIVVYAYAGEVFCHRLIKKIGRRCILKGDTLLCADPPVTWGQVIGRVTMMIVDGSRLVPLDKPWQRRMAAWRARLSYPYALYYRLRGAMARCLHWNRGIRFHNEW
jgi:hypothetical protein